MHFPVCSVHVKPMGLAQEVPRKVLMPLCLGAVCAQLWPYLAAYITAQAAPQVDPMLEANRPAWMESIKLVKCAP